jgi:hypothetical protein
VGLLLAAVLTGSCSESNAAGDRGAGSGHRPQAYVLAAVAPDSDCVYSSSSRFFPTGLLDISPGHGGTKACADGYFVTLGIASEEREILQLSGATVRLLTRDQELIEFDPSSEAPNPFTYQGSQTVVPAADAGSTMTIYTVEAIRNGHAAQLDAFVGEQILIELRLHGSDGSDTPIDFRPFLYPVEICDGCLTLCLEDDLLQRMILPEDVIAGECADNSGSDGRVCIDTDC